MTDDRRSAAAFLSLALGARPGAWLERRPPELEERHRARAWLIAAVRRFLGPFTGPANTPDSGNGR
jgi:hypothetical protein